MDSATNLRIKGRFNCQKGEIQGGEEADRVRTQCLCISCITNFARIHKTLRVTPAMEAGISDRVWSLEEIAGLLN
jgi:hypothetical protein